ncbi:MAG: hypothetical protein GEV03_07275 [Streptosporangiales bacterium]|nr:hypothetical protein [Streptosporangiales bacterium]
MSDPPPEVRELADRRAAARAGRDFPAADALRDRIAALGWTVRDAPGGYELAPVSTRTPPYRVHPTIGGLPDRTGEAPTRRATVALLVEGWPHDLRSCVRALLAHAPGDVAVAALDQANVDGAGDALHELATEHPGRVEEWHVAAPAGWGGARNALLASDTAEIHILADTSTILEGDALTPLLRCFDDPSVVGAGWRGVAVDDDWRGFHDAGPGEVEALLGYLFAVRRDAATGVGGLPRKARFYRNADLEFSLALRDAGLGRLVVPEGELPVRQARHRGYHDTDHAYRDRESKRNYDRLLARFRGREDLRLPS